ncbi:hypothetical protein WA588_004959, partial [Blastocystis sp. NMH]
MSDENSFVFKVYVTDQRRIEQVQELMDAFEIGNLEWDGFEVKRDRAGNYIEATANVSTKFVKKVESRIAKISYVDKVKIVAGGSGSAKANTANDKCTSNRLLDESSVAVLDYAVDYAIGQLRLMKGHLTTATDGNIRGRLVSHFEGDMSVGSTIRLEGKMRYHEHNYPLTEAATITWFASRSHGAWTQVATGPSYSPIAEDAGKHVIVAIHHKGIVAEGDLGAVRVSQEFEDEIQQLLKKRKTLTAGISVLSELTAEEEAKAGRRGEDAILVGKKGVTLQKGGRTLYKAEHGAGVVLSTTRGDPSHAVIRFGERELEVGFGSPRECARCVLAARAYAAWDTVCLICSLPAVEKEVTPDVSVVSALIQAGSAVQPFTWPSLPEVEPEMPMVEEKELETLSRAIQRLAASRRIKASSQAVLTGMLAAVSQGLAPVSLPRPQAWVEPESEEEPEESEEEEEMGVSVMAGPGEAIGEEECRRRMIAAPEGAWSVNEEVFAKFARFFDAGAEEELYDVEKGIALFQKSGEKEKTIREVVALVCGGRGKMNRMEFVVIMHMLKRIKDGVKPPKTLPPELAALLQPIASSSASSMAAVAAKPAKPAKTAKPALSPRSPKKDIEMEEMSAEEEEKPAEAPEEDWSVEEAMVRKLRVTFQKQSEGAAELGVGKAMKLFLKSEVKPRDVGAIVKLVCDGQPKTVSAGQFVVIMILLQKIRGGMAIPPSVPSVLQELLADDADKPDKVDKVDKAKTKTKKEAKETKAPKEDDDAWKLEKSMYNKLKKLFEQQTEGEDTLAPPLAIKCFKKSGVPEETVKTVTKMVLKGHKGPVELGQFVVIMYMLKMIKEG